MKKFFMFAAMASVALVSCVKNEPVATVEQGEAITFNAPIVSPATKAAEQVAFDKESFKVYAYYEGDKSLYINNATVSADNDWKTNYFWPKNDGLSFVAYWPTDETPSVTKDALTLAYTVPDGAQEDLLISQWNKDVMYETKDGAVDVVFHHVLSYVNFNITGTNTAIANVAVTEVTLTGVQNSQTVTSAYAAEKPSWTGEASGSATYEIEGEKLGEIEGDFYLLPQALTNVKLNIAYTIPCDGVDGPSTLAQTAEVALGDAVNTESAKIVAWQQGVKYNYTITFDLKTMTFVPTVVQEDNWKTPVEGTLNPSLN